MTREAEVLRSVEQRRRARGGGSLLAALLLATAACDPPVLPAEEIPLPNDDGGAPPVSEDPPTSTPDAPPNNTNGDNAGGGDGGVSPVGPPAAGSALWYPNNPATSEQETLESVTELPGGDALGVGQARDANGLTRSLLVRADPAGTVRWASRIQTAQPSALSGVLARSSALGGGAFALGYLGPDALLTAVSDQGTLVWAKQAKDAVLFKAASTSDGALVVVGAMTPVNGGPSSDAIVTKLTADGGVVWSKAIRSATSEALFGVAAAPDGSIYGVGHIEAPTTTGYDGLVVKLNAAGALQWARKWAVNGAGAFGSLVVTDDNGVAVAGVANGGASPTGVVIKLSPAGAVDWTYREAASSFSTLLRKADGSFLVGGTAAPRNPGPGNEAWSAYVVGLSATGQAQGARQWQSAPGSEIFEFINRPGGGVFAVGAATPPSAKTHGFLLLNDLPVGTGCGTVKMVSAGYDTTPITLTAVALAIPAGPSFTSTALAIVPDAHVPAASCR